MLNSEFNEFSVTEQQKALDLYPENLRPEIDELNDWIYPWVGSEECGVSIHLIISVCPLSVVASAISA